MQHRHKAHSTGFNLTALGCRTISDEHEILLGSYAVSIGNSLPTLRRNALPSSSALRGLKRRFLGCMTAKVEGNTFLRNVGRRLPVETVQHPQTLSLSHRQIAPCPPQTAPAALCPLHDAIPCRYHTAEAPQHSLHNVKVSSSN
jgi:hypothetical protein